MSQILFAMIASAACRRTPGKLAADRFARNDIRGDRNARAGCTGFANPSTADSRDVELIVARSRRCGLTRVKHPAHRGTTAGVRRRRGREKHPGAQPGAFAQVPPRRQACAGTTLVIFFFALPRVANSTLRRSPPCRPLSPFGSSAVSAVAPQARR
ncbi:MAG TPA: hypothetical protein VET86_09680 [Casimicrobiaceae bacterium]|nr:hypothetical protein [Casimicrobiaceae bacterium]